jgi:hypothetical protein
MTSNDPQPQHPAVLVFLQNPWSYYEDWNYTPASWYYALRRCLTGQRLSAIFGPEEPWPDVRVDNCSPKVGCGSSSKFLPDPDHIRGVLARHATPQTTVVGCGGNAAKALPKFWTGRLLLTPHPAWRFWSTTLQDTIHKEIECIQSGITHDHGGRYVIKCNRDRTIAIYPLGETP